MRLTTMRLCSGRITSGSSTTCTPHFRELKKFLDFWTRELDGLLHSVTIAHARLIKPAEFRAVEGEFRLN